MTNEARIIRKTVLKMANLAKSPHIASALSCVDILHALYAEVMDIPIPPLQKSFAKRDIFILSKAHSAMALYATLYHRGAIDEEKLLGYYKDNGTLPAHTDRNTSPYIEISAGSLGHGLCIAVGMAMAIQKEQNNYGDSRSVFVLMGDGEIQEGSVWEAAMLASKLRLYNLIALIDRNDLQGYGRASELVDYEPLEDKWRAFGWECVRVDGHNERDIIKVIKDFRRKKIQKPFCVICDTIKGKGVSFMEDALKWHYFLVSDEILKSALEEIG